jgi:hypothetical protein
LFTRPILIAIAATLVAGLSSAAGAAPYALLNYPLGMSFEAFVARPIPESAGKKDWKILCADGREMRDHMMGFIGVDHEIETRVGAKTCIFAEPDRISGPKWWKPATVRFAGKPMIWVFRFLSAAQGSADLRLFGILAIYRPEWEHRNEPVDLVEPAMIDRFGAGEKLEREKLAGRIWHDGDQTAEFAAQKLLGGVQQAAFCIAIVDEQKLVELNRRLEPFHRRHWTVCVPQLGRGALQHD